MQPFTPQPPSLPRQNSKGTFHGRVERIVETNPVLCEQCRQCALCKTIVDGMSGVKESDAAHEWVHGLEHINHVQWGTPHPSVGPS
eukprot:3939412-Rhodomonas_salina.1